MSLLFITTTWSPQSSEKGNGRTNEVTSCYLKMFTQHRLKQLWLLFISSYCIFKDTVSNNNAIRDIRKLYSNVEYPHFQICSLWFCICQWSWCSLTTYTNFLMTQLVNSKLHTGINYFCLCFIQCILHTNVSNRSYMSWLSIYYTPIFWTINMFFF